MWAGMLILTFDVVKKYPGLTIDKLAEKIGTEYAYLRASPLLVHYDYEGYYFLNESFRNLNCLEERNGKYYFNSERKPYSSDELVNDYIENRLQSEKKKN